MVSFNWLSWQWSISRTLLNVYRSIRTQTVTRICNPSKDAGVGPILAIVYTTGAIISGYWRKLMCRGPSATKSGVEIRAFVVWSVKRKGANIMFFFFFLINSNSLIYYNYVLNEKTKCITSMSIKIKRQIKGNDEIHPIIGIEFRSSNIDLI